MDMELIKRLCDINPNMKLRQSDPTTYDNNPTLIQNIIKNKQRGFSIKVESRGIIYQLISRFLQNAKPKIKAEDGRIKKLFVYSKNIYEPINIEQLSEISCLSKDHFIRLFKKEMGSTPIQYITQRKWRKPN